jgi:hypothetical protein
VVPVDPLSPYEVGAPDFSYVHPIDEAKVRWFMDQLDGEPPLSLPYCDSSVCMYVYAYVHVLPGPRGGHSLCNIANINI